MRFKTGTYLFLLALVLLAPFPSMAEEEKPAPVAVPAPEEKPTVDFSTYFLSQYIWRGQELTKGGVVAQPSLAVAYKGFGASLWGNLDTNPYSGTDERHSSTWTETDLTLSYSRTWGILNAGIGYIYYGLSASNPGGVKPPDSQEVYATIGLNTLLAPTLTVYKEIDHYKQWYFLLGVSHAFELNKAVSLKLAASASYLKSDDADPNDPLNTGYPRYNDSGIAQNERFDNFHDGVVSAALPIAVAKYVTVTPTIAYVFPLSGEAKNEMKGRSKNREDSSYLYGGLWVSFAF